MALKLWQKNRWNGNKQHKDGLNTDRDMAYSSERETTNSKFRLGTYNLPHSPKRVSIILTTVVSYPSYFSDVMSLNYVLSFQSVSTL